MNTFSLAASIFFFVFSSASAQELTSVRIEPAEITVGQPVDITVDLKSQENSRACGILIAFGDGRSQRIRVDAEKLPAKLTHTYEQVGNFAISVEGNLQIRGLSSVLPCSGSTRTAAVNVRAEDFAAREAAEKAAQEAALQKAASERQAAERAAHQATVDRRAAESAAQRAASERATAEKAVAAGASARAAAEKEAARSAAVQRAAEKAAADRAVAAKEAARNAALQRETANASAATTAAEQPASAKANEEPSRSRPPTVDAPKKSAPRKAGSAMDL